MEVILQQDFPSLGFVGDRVDVRNGYARNYLIPRGVAVEVTSRSAKMLNHKVAVINAKKAKLRSEATAVAEKLKGVKIELKLKMGERGKSFGSVGSRDLERALAEKGYAVDRRQIILTESVRSPGEYTFQVKLHAEVLAPVTLSVTADRPQRAKKAAEEEEGTSEAQSDTEEHSDTKEHSDTESTGGDEGTDGEEQTSDSE